MATESAIARVIQHYHPTWEPPSDKREWNQCLCPSHAEDNPSCAVSYVHNAVKCQACDYKGDLIAIIRREEGCSYEEAVSKATELTQDCGGFVPKPASRKRRRPVFE